MLDAEREQRHLREAARLLRLGVEIDAVDDPEETRVEQYAVDLCSWLEVEAVRAGSVPSAEPGVAH